MMAGVVSANVVLVALANDILRAGPRGLGFLETGWATGAIIGGLIASQLPQSLRMPLYVAACAGLAGRTHGNSLRCVSGWGSDDADCVWILPRAGWRRGAVFADEYRAKTFYGANAIRDGDPDDSSATLHESCTGIGSATRGPRRELCASGIALYWGYRLCHPRAPALAISCGFRLITGRRRRGSRSRWQMDILSAEQIHGCLV